MEVWLYIALVCAQLSLSVCMRVICFYPEYRFVDLPPKDFDPTLCTHIHLAFHTLDATRNVILDAHGSARPALYNSLKTLKKRNNKLKLMVVLGGKGMPDQPMSTMISGPKLRAAFIKNTIAYLKKYGFDGIAMNWMYPVCWSGDCTKGPTSDNPNYGKLFTELRQAFNKQKPRLLLTATIAGSYTGSVSDKAYAIPAIANAVDYLTFSTYGATPAMATAGKAFHWSNMVMAYDWVQPYIDRGVPKAKIVIALPFYALVFTLQDPTQHTVGAPITGAGNIPGGAGGIANYTQICDLVKNKGWTKERNKNGNDPFAYNGSILVGYDDPWQMYIKAKYVKDQGLGGVLAWEIGQDDRHFCCTVRFPLLRAINNVLFNTGKGISTYGCEHK